MIQAISKAVIAFTVVSRLASPQAIVGIRSQTSAPAAPQVKATDVDTGHRVMEAARPLLGYVTDSSNRLFSVVGSTGIPQWGEALSLPDSTAVAFLPPRQEYALLASEAGLSIARLSRSAVYPGATIPNAMSRPQRVAFSPSGEAAAMFSATESRIEVMTYVVQQARVIRSLSVSNADDLKRFAISDDGELVVAGFFNQPAMYSLHGAGWLPLTTSYTPDAWIFLPHSRDLVLSDISQGVVALLPEVGKTPLVARLLASDGVKANLLSVDKQGHYLLAVAPGTPAFWSIDLAGGAVASLTARDKLDSLTLLRDGQTFLISMKESPLIVKLGGDVAQSAVKGIPTR